MKNLDRLHRKCRHDPKMGGNTETIALPCTLVARLVGLAQSLERVVEDLNHHGMDAIHADLVYADDEAAAYFSIQAHHEPNTSDQPVGGYRWAWMMDWCRKNGLAPANIRAWERAGHAADACGVLNPPTAQ
jgi:hypothetical protein